MMVAALAQQCTDRFEMEGSGWRRPYAWLSLGYWPVSHLSSLGLGVTPERDAFWPWRCLLWRSREGWTWFHPLPQERSAPVTFPLQLPQ